EPPPAAPPLPPRPPLPPLPPRDWLPRNVLSVTVRVEPPLLIAPPGPPLPLPPDAPLPPLPPAPPMAWLPRNVHCATVMAEGTNGTTKLVASFEMAPPTPKPPLPPFWPGPPPAPLAPRARLESNVLYNTVAWLPAALPMAPARELPGMPGPGPRAVVAWLPVKVPRSTNRVDPASFEMAPPRLPAVPAAWLSAKVQS